MSLFAIYRKRGKTRGDKIWIGTCAIFVVLPQRKLMLFELELKDYKQQAGMHRGIEVRDAIYCNLIVATKQMHNSEQQKKLLPARIVHASRSLTCQNWSCNTANLDTAAEDFSNPWTLYSQTLRRKGTFFERMRFVQIKGRGHYCSGLKCVSGLF